MNKFKINIEFELHKIDLLNFKFYAFQIELIFLSQID